MGGCKHGACNPTNTHPIYKKYDGIHQPLIARESVTAKFAEGPGLADPFTVVKTCLPVLSSGVYMSHNLRKENQNSGFNFCEGIRIYLEDWALDPVIERSVQRYIQFPCVMELRSTISTNQKKALQFLLSYLRRRGPLMNWEIRPGTDEVMGRCLKTVLAGNLHQLTDLEFTSAVMIGRYLQYVVTIGYSHDLFYLRSILAKVWGPVFLRPFYSQAYKMHHPLTEEDRVNLAITLFDKIIETAPWHTYVPFESMHKVIIQENISLKTYVPDYTRLRNRVPYNPEQDKARIPNFLRGTMSDKFRDEFIQHAVQTTKPECPVHSTPTLEAPVIQREPDQAGDSCTIAEATSQPYDQGSMIEEPENHAWETTIALDEN